MACSDDGRQFTRLGRPVLYPDDDECKPYEWEGGCEDLHIIEGEDGTYYMNYTAWTGNRDAMLVATKAGGRYLMYVSMPCGLAESENPGQRVRLGGPALAWAFSFRFGDFNWSERFLENVGREKTKLDFLGLHFYGNISPLAGERASDYPSFSRMMQATMAPRRVEAIAPGNGIDCIVSRDDKKRLTALVWNYHRTV